MTKYTSAAAGNWSAASTWSPSGVPGDGDYAIVDHAVTVDVAVTVGASAPGFTSTGLNSYAVLVNGAQGAANHNSTTNADLATAVGALTVAAGVTLTARGDVVLNGGPLAMSAGSSLLFDSTQAATPASQSYVLEVMNSYGNTAGRFVCNGTSGSHVTVGRVAGSGNPRITAGDKVLGYSTYDAGIVQAAYADFSNLGDATHKAITFRIGGPTSGAPYHWFLSNCTFTGCGLVRPYSSVGGQTYFDVTGCAFSGGTDTSVGGDLYVDVADSAVQTGFTRNVTGNSFGLPLFVANGAFTTVHGNLLGYAHQIYVTGNQTGLVIDGNEVYIPPAAAYAGGGGWSIPHGITYTNNHFMANSPADVNSHLLLLNGGSGLTTIEGNVFEIDQAPSGYYGGNCIILEAAASGSATTNVCTIMNNLVLPAANTTAAGNGLYVAAGTLITLLQAAAQQNFTTVIEQNTCITPHGIGCVDPDENAAGAAGVFSSVRNNLFWWPGAAATTGYSMWFNTNSGARTSTPDEVAASNLDYNAHWNPRTTTTCTSSGATVTTPAYQNGVFSSGIPGTHDLVLNPSFVDCDRNMPKWDASLGGPGTTAHAVAQIAAGTSGYTVAAYVAYARAGLTPQNAALRGAGYNGNDIGAVSVALPPALTVTSVTMSPATGDIGVGGTVTVTVHLSGAATLAGTPTLTLTDGGTAAYVPGSSSASAYVFSTTVAAGQSAAHLGVSAWNAGTGGNLTDSFGQAVNLTGAIGVPAAAPQVDGVAPFATVTTFSPASGLVGAGGSLSVTLTMSKPVTVTGTPRITLNATGGTLIASYVAGASTSTALVFTCAVSAGMSASPVALLSLSLNGGTVSDVGSGTPASLVPLPAAMSAPTIDAVAPTLVSLSASPSGTVAAGGSVVFTAVFSKPVTGSASLSTSSGVPATLTSGSGTATLAWTLPVSAGQNSNGVAVAITGVSGGILDAAGNPFANAALVGTPSGSPIVAGGVAIAGKKLSQFPMASTLGSSDSIYAVVGGSTQQLTLAVLKHALGLS